MSVIAFSSHFLKPQNPGTTYSTPNYQTHEADWLTLLLLRSFPGSWLATLSSSQCADLMNKDPI